MKTNGFQWKTTGFQWLKFPFNTLLGVSNFFPQISCLVLAEGVLKGEVELVLLHDLLEALVPPLGALERLATPAEDLHWNVLLQLFDVELPLRAGLTVGDEPGNRFSTSKSSDLGNKCS